MITCVLDGDKILDKDMLHDKLANSLHFPDWYGRNLDALYDCLTDMEEGVVIQFLQKDMLEKHLGKYAEMLFQVVLASAKENSSISCQFL